MTIQISFLGKANLTKTGYRPARYRLDEKTVIETPFFGLALAGHQRPARLVLLGTPGSMWDVLLEAHLDKTALETERLELQDRAIAETVDEALLGRFAPKISERLGLPCELRIISYGRNEGEQAEMVRRLAQWLSPGDDVVMDVTHGLRHLPMLMLAAAHYLEKVRRVKVTEIFYAALDMTPRDVPAETPVLRLSGLLRMLDWVEAFSAYDADGDYGVFSELLSGAGASREASEALRQAAFMERISRDGEARRWIKEARTHLADHPLGGIAEVFADPLDRRLAWVDEERMFERQRELAGIYLERRDYIRAAIFGFEAFITRLVDEAGGRPQKYDERMSAKENYDPYSSREYKLLRDLRNALAHGIAPTRAEVQRALADEQTLQTTLAGLIQHLLIDSRI